MSKRSAAQVEENVEDAQKSINAGYKQIVSAAKLKTAAYSLTGILGKTLIGGPISFAVGLKASGLAAHGCRAVDYVDGKIFKKSNNSYERTTSGRRLVTNRGCCRR